MAPRRGHLFVEEALKTFVEEALKTFVEEDVG
jgi:hypothetical protein